MSRYDEMPKFKWGAGRLDAQPWLITLVAKTALFVIFDFFRYPEVRRRRLKMLGFKSRRQ